MLDLATVDWAEWAQRWEAQQQWHIPRREQRFQLMLEMVAETLGDAPGLVLDLACGPGSISRRVMERFPTAAVVALDADPLLLEIGRRTLGDGSRRLQWVHADLRTTDWADRLRLFAPFDAMLTATALHWLSAGDLVQVYRHLGDLMRPGGVFCNAEHLLLAPPAGRLGAAAQKLRHRLGRDDRGDGESWDDWWQAARAEPHFGELFASRDQVFGEVHPHHESLTARFHEEALALAGFAEAAVVWRFLDDTIVAAIR
jgi:SAM-dependent methyltransferase